MNQSVSRHDLSVFTRREPDLIRAHSTHRRADVQWVDLSEPPRWKALMQPAPSRREQFFIRSALFVSTPSVEITAPGSIIGVDIGPGLFVFAGSPIGHWLGNFIDSADAHDPTLEPASRLVSMMLQAATRRGRDSGAIAFGLAPTDIKQQLRRMVSESVRLRDEAGDVLAAIESVELQSLFDAVSQTDGTFFDPRAWRRDATSLGTY